MTTEWRRLDHRQKVAAVKAAWDRDSADTLAKKVGTTRGGISGIYERNKELRVSHPLCGVGGQNTRDRSLDRIAARKPVSARQPPRVIPMPKPTKPIARPSVEMRLDGRTECRVVRMVDLQRRECRYPLNSPERMGIYYFCAEDATQGSSYCERHAKVCMSAERRRVR